MSENIICGKCGSGNLKTVYFTQELDPVKKRVSFHFTHEEKEGSTKTHQCLDCEYVSIKTNIFK